MAPYRVLVVDDSAFMRRIISDIVSSDKSFAVAATARNGQEAIEAARALKPDVITLDLEMPVMNGIEALQQLMKEMPLPVIMLSGISEDNIDQTIRALQSGAFDFIRKPSNGYKNEISEVSNLLLEKMRAAAAFHKLERLGVKQSKKEQVDLLTSDTQEVLSLEEQRPASSEVEVQKQVAATDSGASDEKGSSFTESQAKSTATNRALDAIKAPLSEVPSKRSTSSGSSLADLREQIAARTQETLRQQNTSSASTSPRNIVRPKPDAAQQLEQSGPQRTITSEQVPVIASPATPTTAAAIDKPQGSRTFRHVVAIGTSTGGPRALHEVICNLPRTLEAPVLVVQHMPARFTKSLAQRLNQFAALHVVEAEHGQPVVTGTVYIAPGGRHMALARQPNGYVIQLHDQPPRSGHRPSVDVMFESLVELDELQRHAVIMTGMGSDGTKGLEMLVASGVESTIAEAEETCIVYGMPRAAIESGNIQTVLPLQKIASHITKAASKLV